jgi:hypothetical protein
MNRKTQRLKKFLEIAIVITALELSCGLLCHTSAQSQPAEGYEKHQILFLKWGAGDHEIGLDALNNSGPTALAIDKNENIYITDPVNKRIQIFSIAGNFIKSVPSDAIVPSLEVDDEGDIFTTYSLNGKWSNKLLLVQKDGKRIKYEMPSGIIQNSILYSYDGKKIYSFGDNGQKKFSNSRFNQHLFFKDDFKYSVDKQYGGNVVLIVSTKKIKEVLRKDGKTTNSDSIEISLSNKKDFSLCSKVLGFDDDGNIYIATFYRRFGTNNYSEPSIQIYSMDGKEVAKIPLDIDFCFGGFINENLLQVDKFGDVYQLLSTKSGVYVFKWIKD